MVKYIVFATVALFALQGVIAKPKGQKAEKSQLEELAANAQQVVNNVTATLQGNLPDSKQVVESLNTNAQNLANQVQTIVDKIKGEVKNNQGEIDNVLKDVSNKLSETATKLKSALGPEGQRQAAEIKNNLDKGLKEAVAQVDKLAKAIEPEATKLKTELTDAAKNFLDQIVQIGKDIQGASKSSH